MSDSASTVGNEDMKVRVEVELRQLPFWRFASEQRERMREANGGVEKPWDEMARLVGEAWTALDAERRQEYVDAATSEIIEYERNHDTSFWTNRLHARLEHTQPLPPQAATSSKLQESVSQPEAKAPTRKRDRKRKLGPAPPPARHSNDRRASKRECADVNAAAEAASHVDAAGESTHIPIFTPAFLMHNKQQEVNLRNLRKEISDVEDERGNLFKHLELLEGGMEKLRNELAESQRLNSLLEGAHESIVEQVEEALHLATVEQTATVDLGSKASRLSAARKYIRLCISQSNGVQLSDVELEFVCTVRKMLSDLVVTC